MIKKIIACLMVLVLLCLTACGNMSSVRCADDVMVYGDTKAKDPLRVCIDMYHGSGSAETELMTEFLERLNGLVELSDVIVEWIPSNQDGNGRLLDSSVRAAALDRIRAEIMAGEGPDVFIMEYTGATDPLTHMLDPDKTNCLFKYPEKAMENGVFLPLDEYMENNTQLTEWDKQIEAVLAAGQNDEGQQIIPLNYSFPLLAYPKTAGEHIPDKKYTWNDMLTHHDLLPYSRDLANFGWLHDEWATSTADLIHVIGTYADFEKEELLITEEELLKTVREILSLEQKDTYESLDKAEEIDVSIYSLRDDHFNIPMTFMPFYSRNGGVTAEIYAFAAVNRNTKRPEDAFKVIDLLMSKEFQRTSRLYNEVINLHSLPLHEELFQKSTPIAGGQSSMTDENFAAFSAVRAQLTDAVFESEGVFLFNRVLWDCMDASVNGEKTVEEIVHEYYIDLERRMRE